MFLENFDPLKDEMIQIMDKDGVVVRPDLMPELTDEEIVEIYKPCVSVVLSTRRRFSTSVREGC
jgi:hypothetical protein